MIVLSLDLSLNCTGWSVFDSSKRKPSTRLLGVGTINNKHLNSSQTGIKLINLELQLKGLLIAYNPDVIVIEALTGDGFADTTKNAMAHAVLERLTTKFNNIERINNKTFKKQFAGNGNALKDDVAIAVRRYYPDFYFRTNDESDSMGLGIYYLQTVGAW